MNQEQKGKIDNGGFDQGAPFLPEPLSNDAYKIFRVGVYDNDGCSVYINSQRDFAFLYPYTKCDYSSYVPRVQKLGQTAYKKKRKVYSQRFRKIDAFFGNNVSSVIEIGAGEGSFLSVVRDNYADIKITAVEPDLNTLEERQRIEGISCYETIEQAAVSGKYDVVCLFHVLEHIFDVKDFFVSLKALMHNKSILIIEVPSIDDPLLSIYGLKAYEKFYFQVQHPFVYSRGSLERVMSHNGFVTEKIIDFQRYGIENHLQWITAGKPGGNPLFEKLLEKSAQPYLQDLEKAHKTDTVIWVGKKRNAS